MNPRHAIELAAVCLGLLWRAFLIVCWIVAVIILAIICNSFYAVGEDKMIPPKLEGIMSLSCTCKQIKMPTGESWWHTHVIVEYDKTFMVKLYSIRPGNERKKALEDCDRWMRDVHKAVHKKAKNRLTTFKE